MSGFDFKDFQVSGSTGMDAAFEPERTANRIRVASLTDLKGFTRVAKDTLINTSARDLWSIKPGSNGTFVIERMFEDNGEPIKG